MSGGDDPVLLGELLDTPPADLELLGDDLGVHVMVDNSLTDPGNLFLVKLHFSRLITGQIMPTKSFPDSTVATASTVALERDEAELAQILAKRLAE